MICEGQVIACIEEPAVVARILRHLGPRAAQAPPSTADDKPTDPLLRFVQRAQWDRLKRLGHSLVRNNRDDDTFLHTACTLGVVRTAPCFPGGCFVVRFFMVSCRTSASRRPPWGVVRPWVGLG